MRRAITKTMFGAARNKPTPQSVTSNIDVSAGSAPLSHMQIGSKWSYSTLEYPIDIQTRSDLGHYMMFYVNVMDTNRSAYSTYNSMSPRKRSYYQEGPEEHEMETKEKLTGARKALRDEQKFSGDMAPAPVSGDSSTYQPGQREKVIDRAHSQGRLAKSTASWGLDQRTKRTTDSVVLYMPPTIQTNTNVVYKGSEMGNMASTIMGAGGNIYSASQSANAFDAVMELIPGLIDVGIVELQRLSLKAAGAIVGGDLVGASDKLSNRAQNRYLESLYDNIGFRKFSYTYKFTPKSAEEAISVRQIIQLFKFHMSPELPEDDLGRYFIPPAEFDLFYMFRGDENDFLNKITSCVLTNMDINYANGRFQTFREFQGGVGYPKGAPPTEIEMKLDFMETQIITKKEVLEGY